MASPEEARAGEVAEIRSVISRFLEERLEPKLAKLQEEELAERQKLLETHQPACWIADAAHRVGQIQQVSHSVKFTHPSAEGSSLSSFGNEGAEMLEVGTHILQGEWRPDVVGNAAALDVYKFLRLEAGGKTLLDRAITQDPALIKAFGDDVKAREWAAAFATLPESKGPLASHKLAKQVYWPLGGGSYHLLSPLFSSPLAQAVYKRINKDRFSEEAKAAHEARRAGKAHHQGCRDYPNLAIQSFGGSKPQNISQLNSERRGENYLLASVPPQWESAAVKLPLKVNSVFKAKGFFARRSEVRRVVEVLQKFLHGVADVKGNMHIRRTRYQLVASLCDQVLQMAAELRELEPGWSAGADCHLNLAEQCWLDPERGVNDEGFATHYRRGDWKDEVCSGFANWLNVHLQTRQTLFGAAEAQEWRRMLDQELRMLKEELSYV